MGKEIFPPFSFLPSLLKSQLRSKLILLMLEETNPSPSLILHMCQVRTYRILCITGLAVWEVLLQQC